MHEIIHAISRLQSVEQKNKLTTAFFQAYPLKPSLPKYHIIEEPLAVAVGQMLYLSLFNREKFRECERKKENQWYMDEWINNAGQEIFPLIKQAYEQGQCLDVGLVTKMAEVIYKAKSLEKFNSSLEFFANFKESLMRS